MAAFEKTVPFIDPRIKQGADATDLQEEFVPEALEMYREKYSRTILAGFDNLCSAYKQMCISEGDVFSTENFVKYLITVYNVCPRIFKASLYESDKFDKHKKIIERVLSKYSVQLLEAGIYENRMDEFWLRQQVKMIRLVFNVQV